MFFDVCMLRLQTILPLLHSRQELYQGSLFDHISHSPQEYQHQDFHIQQLNANHQTDVDKLLRSFRAKIYFFYNVVKVIEISCVLVFCLGNKPSWIQKMTCLTCILRLADGIISTATPYDSMSRFLF